jgi:hypothetical protein
MIIGDETEQYFHVIWKFHKLYLKKTELVESRNTAD